MTVATVILAGGAGSRMGGVCKALLPLDGKPLLAHLLDRLAFPGPVALAAHDDADAALLAGFGLPVLRDGFADRRGPLAGILAGLAWARGSDGLVTLPVDSPFLPADIAPRLTARAEETDAEIVTARCEREHPTVAWWSPALEPSLRAVVTEGRDLAIRRFAALHHTTELVFPLSDAAAFRNLNTPEELQAASA